MIPSVRMYAGDPYGNADKNCSHFVKRYDVLNLRKTIAKDTATMDILQKEDGKKGMFYIENEDIIQAEMTYVWAGDTKIIIDHTEVSEALQGKSAGKQLLKKAVEFAREKGVKILPLCPFANAVFKRTPEYNDVLF